jgi:hypothetical protein
MHFFLRSPAARGLDRLETGLPPLYRPKDDPEPEIRKGELPWVIFCTFPPSKPSTRWCAWPIQRKANKREIELRQKIEAILTVTRCSDIAGSEPKK